MRVVLAHLVDAPTKGLSRDRERREPAAGRSRAVSVHGCAGIFSKGDIGALLRSAVGGSGTVLMPSGLDADQWRIGLWIIA